MESHLVGRLGVELATRPDGAGARGRRDRPGGAGAVLLPPARITSRTRELVEALTSRFGREPSPRERTRLAQQVTLATRAAKSHGGESLGQRLDRWKHEARQAVAGGLNQVGHDVVARAQQPGPAGEWSVQDVVERALADVGRARASWFGARSRCWPRRRERGRRPRPLARDTAPS
jgi:hypothetical protein